MKSGRVHESSLITYQHEISSDVEAVTFGKDLAEGLLKETQAGFFVRCVIGQPIKE